MDIWLHPLLSVVWNCIHILNFKYVTFKAYDWISNLIIHFTGRVVTNQAGIKVKVIKVKEILVNGAPENYPDTWNHEVYVGIIASFPVSHLYSFAYPITQRLIFYKHKLGDVTSMLEFTIWGLIWCQRGNEETTTRVVDLFAMRINVSKHRRISNSISDRIGHSD